MELNVYTNRWGHNEKYNINRIQTGWEITFNATGGRCDKEGRPYLYDILNKDNISYPNDLGMLLESLWILAEQNSMDGVNTDIIDAKVQEHLNSIGEWITLVEQKKPDFSFETF